MKLNSLFEGFSQQMHKADSDSSDIDSELSNNQLSSIIDKPMDSKIFINKINEILKSRYNYKENIDSYNRKFITFTLKTQPKDIINNSDERVIIKYEYSLELRTENRFNNDICHDYFDLFIPNKYKDLKNKIKLIHEYACSVNVDNILVIPDNSKHLIDYDGEWLDPYGFEHNMIIANNKNLRLLVNAFIKFMNNK